MSWYTVYKTSDGALKGHGQSIPDPLPSHLTSINHGNTRQDQGQQWNSTSKEWESRPAPRLISYADYLNRFTLQERGQVYQSTEQTSKSFLTALQFEGLIGQTADLDDNFLKAITGLLVSEGIIDAQRKAEILA